MRSLASTFAVRRYEEETLRESFRQTNDVCSPKKGIANAHLKNHKPETPKVLAYMPSHVFLFFVFFFVFLCVLTNCKYVKLSNIYR